MLTPRTRQGGLSWLTALLFACVALAAIAGQAKAASKPVAKTPAAAYSAGIDDPWEHGNRKRFTQFQSVDRSIILPAALAYERVVPARARNGLRNFVANLASPSIFLNDLLQFRPKNAFVTAWRFALNSTVGVAGLIDVAGHTGAVGHTNDFGITMARYGVKPGPYLVSPFTGPSTVRDTIGTLVDDLANPFIWAKVNPGDLLEISRASLNGASTVVSASSTVVGGLDTRVRAQSDLDQALSTATDPYATLRSLYLQNRESEVRGADQNIDLPNIDVADTPSTVTTAAAAPDAPLPQPQAEAADHASPQGGEAAAEPAPKASLGPVEDLY